MGIVVITMGKPFDHIGRALSLLIFIAGVGLLGVVFAVAYHMLTNPVPGLGAALSATAATGKAASASGQPLVGISSAVLSFLLRLAVLFVMTIAASLIAAKGVNLYFAAIGAAHAQGAPQPVVSSHSTTSEGSHLRIAEANGSQSAVAPAVSSGTLVSREGPSKREGEGGASSGEAVAGPRQ